MSEFLRSWRIGLDMAIGAIVWNIVSAFSAETLTPVSPPTDWTGVGVVAVIGALLVAIVGVILYYRRPGLQPGEEALDAILSKLDAIHTRVKAQPTINHTINVAAPAVAPSAPAPGLVCDGITFADAASLAAYKAAKEKR